MVGFIHHDDEQEDINFPSKLKNSIDPTFTEKFDFLDQFVPEIDDLLLPANDSFLDLDSINDWMEEMLEPEVEKLCETLTVETEQPAAINGSEKEGEGFENSPMENSDKLLSLNCVVEEGLGKVSLVDQLESNPMKDSEVVSEGLKDESCESCGTECECESSSASSSSSSSSSDEEDEDDNDDVDEKEKKIVIKEELEEGEIMQTDAEKMACYSSEASDEEDDVKDDMKDVVSDDLFLDNEFDEDEDSSGGVLKPIKSKNELSVLPPVLPVDVTLEPSHQMLPVGFVSSVLGAQVIVEGGEKHNPLSEGSILWMTEKRSPLGRVDEIFGPVKNPYYIVRYNSESEVPEGIHEGTLVSFVPEFVDHVLNNTNLYQKGYDASGENDEEIDEAEFSDDEKEAEYRKMLKMSKRGNNNTNTDMKPGGNKKSNRSFSRNDMQSKNSTSMSTNTKNRQAESPARPPPDHNNRPGSSRFSPSYPTGPTGVNPRFPQQGHQPGFTPNGPHQQNGMPFHMQNGNGFQTPWIQNQNPQQFPMMNIRPPFQQAFNPAGPPTMGTGPSFPPMPTGNMPPNALNQLQLPMALQAQLAQLSMLSGMLLAGQGVHPNLQQNAGMLPPQFNQGPQNADMVSPQFNQGPQNAGVLPSQFNQGPQNADMSSPQFNQGPQNADVSPTQFNQGAVSSHHGGRPQNADVSPPQFNQGAAPTQFNQGGASRGGGRSFQRRGSRGGRSRGGGRRGGGRSFQSR